MSRYTTEYFSEYLQETICVVEMERLWFTKNDWKYLLGVATKFLSDCSDLTISVFNNGKLVFEANMQVEYPANANSPAIVYLFINHRLQRIWRRAEK